MKYRENGRKTPHIMDLRTTDTRIAEIRIRRLFFSEAKHPGNAKPADYVWE
jgi:hypothetical protein